MTIIIIIVSLCEEKRKQKLRNLEIHENKESERDGEVLCIIIVTWS